jgi:hypothetical protein
MLRIALPLVVLIAAASALAAPPAKRPAQNTRCAATNIVTGYLDLGYKPTRKDLVVVYRIEPANRMPVSKVAEHLAAESSIGTWTDISTVNPAAAARLRPHVYSIRSRRRASARASSRSPTPRISSRRAARRRSSRRSAGTSSG